MMSHLGFHNIAHAIMWCNETVAAAIICMIRPFGPLESRTCAQPSSILFSLYPLTENSLSFIPLGFLILVWAACAQNFSKDLLMASGLQRRQSEVKPFLKSVASPFHFQSEWPVCQFTRSQVQMTSSWSDISWQHQITSNSQLQTKPLLFIWIN